MIKLVNMDGLLCIEKGNGCEEICRLDELKAISIKRDDILIETCDADISFEIERGRSSLCNSKNVNCGGGCGCIGSKEQ